MNEMEIYDMIPWDFFGLLLLILGAALTITLVAYGLKVRRRAKLTNPRKDHVYGPGRQHRHRLPQE